MKRAMSYHLIKNTTDAGFVSLCGLSIDKRAVGEERLVTNDATEVTCPMCICKLADEALVNAHKNCNEEFVIRAIPNKNYRKNGEKESLE